MTSVVLLPAEPDGSELPGTVLELKGGAVVVQGLDGRLELAGYFPQAGGGAMLRREMPMRMTTRASPIQVHTLLQLIGLDTCFLLGSVLCRVESAGWEEPVFAGQFAQST